MSKVIEINCTTGESIERDMTPEELESQAAMQAKAEEDRASAEAEAAQVAADKAAAVAALVALGLTEAQIAALSK